MKKRDIALLISYFLVLTTASIYFLRDTTGSFSRVPHRQLPLYTDHFPERNTPLKLMPIGDSITHASPKTGNYRCLLWNILQDLDDFDFVGNMRGMVNREIEMNCDGDHESHARWKADQVLKVIRESATSNTPDIALIHLGTNDLVAGNSHGSTAHEIFRIITILREQSPHIAVLVAGIIPNYQLNNQNKTIELNRRIRNMAESITSRNQPVIFVDQFSGYTPADSVDKIHPNRAGSEKIARKFHEALRQLL